MVTYMVNKLINQVREEGWCRDPNFKLVFGAVCVEMHPGKKFVRGSEEEEGLPPKKTKASVLAKLQLENEMVEEDNPDELMKGNP